MKKLLLSLFALLVLGLPKVSAQLINADFETWNPNPNNLHNAPDPNTGEGTSGWWDFNVVSNPFVGSSPFTVLEGDTNPLPESGKHYAVVVSDTMSRTSYDFMKRYGFPYARTNGLLFTGYENVILTPPSATLKTGIPITGGELNSFSFYYRYIPHGSDSCSCSISMFYWDPNLKKRTLIGTGLWGDTARQKNWTSVTIPISYTNTQVNPDTVLIVFSACAIDSLNKPKQFDTLDVDNSSVTGIGGIDAPHDNVNLYPNPAQTEINLSVTGNYQALYVEVYDITGRAIGSYSMKSNFLSINTQSYGNGEYVYKLLDNAGIQLNVGKFSVVK